MKTNKIIDDNPLRIGSTEEIKIVNIAFNDYTSHYSIFKQVTDGLRKAGYANKREILDIFKENIL